MSTFSNCSHLGWIGGQSCQIRFSRGLNPRFISARSALIWFSGFR